MKSTDESSKEENIIDSDLLSESSPLLSDTSDSSDSDLEPITSKLQNEISSIRIYQDAATIAEKIILIIDIPKLYHTLIELSIIDFGAFNQIQSVSLNLQEHLDIENLENYLPSYNIQSKQCQHILEDKHFAVLFAYMLHTMKMHILTDIRRGNVYNYCPCHRIFRKICKENLQGQCSDQY